MKTFSVGIIGWGFMGRMHAEALRAIPLYYPQADFSVRLAAICTRRAEKAQEAERAAGFERAYTDYRALLADGDIDVVSICTPNAAHEEMAIAALRAGKHVYIDKPLSIDSASARRIADVARECPVQSRVAFNYRYFPATLRMKQLIDEGRIGKLMHFSLRYLHNGSIDAAKPVGWKQMGTGGALLDMGSHVLDLTTWLLGAPQRVQMKSRRLYAERPLAGGGVTADLGDDYALCLLEMPDGAIGTVEASKIATGSNDDLYVEILGERGALRWNLMSPNYLEYYDADAAGGPYGGLRGYTHIECVAHYEADGGTYPPGKNTIGWTRGHVHCYYTFLNALAHNAPCGCDIAEAARLQALMDALTESERRGAWMEVV